MKNILALALTSFVSSHAFADACFIVNDRYSTAAYQVVYHGGPGLEESNFYVDAISVQQIRQSDLTASSPQGFVGPMWLTIMSRPSDRDGGDIKAVGYQGSTKFELNTGSHLDDITIYHKFYTYSGQYHTHIAADVTACPISTIRVPFTPEGQGEVENPGQQQQSPVLQRPIQQNPTQQEQQPIQQR